MPKFSDVFGVRPDGWLNIELDSDQEYYLDPLKFPKVTDPDFDGQEAELLVQKYMGGVDAMLDRPDMKVRRLALLDAPCEMNETRLGLGQGKPKGTGPSPEMLEKVFRHMRDIKGFKVAQHSEGLLMFTEHFGTDRHSDLITCIVARELVAFTQRKCRRYHIEMVKDCPIKMFNPATLEWEELLVELPVYNGLPILLVPVDALVEQYDYTAEHYVHLEVLEGRKFFLQQQGLSMTKAEIYKMDTADIKHNKCKTLALRSAVEEPKRFVAYLDKRRLLG